MQSYLDHIKRATPKPFTAGDLVEGFSFMEVPYRRAILFGLDMALPASRIENLTRSELKDLRMTALAAAVVGALPVHPRLPYLFWEELTEGGVCAPLFEIERVVESSFGGMSLADLQRLYGKMLWVDPETESDDFWMNFQAGRPPCG